MKNSVVVGADGSTRSLAAVDLAAREAALRDLPLRVVYAYLWPYVAAPPGGAPVSLSDDALRHDAERVVREAVERAHATAPSVDVTGEAIVSAPAPTLIEHSRTASLVVVGDRGLGGFTGLLVGSVAVQLAAHAACPVLVARGRTDAGGDVLVGVDGSPANEPAVGFAFEEAALRGVVLTALHAWTHPVRTEPGDMLPLVYDAGMVEAEEERVLAEALAGWRDKYPDVPVRRQLVHGHTRRALIDATERAQLAVVGSRGRGGFTGLLLGSVSQAVLHHAACPVGIVHHAAGRS
ncbi:universal stress protein [Planosporangium flavigriseum]|uniref:Universal stress protein n=1 Tax=Planosporangium flavigriseum TaxID=373681 RepID=A0A8J3PN26_9ACTN|nr:universal stress protein [Planosporangium flavigriseum]NJC67444.1 universal stress protein [Planosporangium flavigriseum]GIG74914.1 universal stress protein [Planosporangium flavigriseum]